MVQVCVICPTLERTPSARTRSSGLFFLSRVKFSPKAKSRSINWELAPESIIQVAWRFSLTTQGKVMGSSDPKSLHFKGEDKESTEIEEIFKAAPKRGRRPSLCRDLRKTAIGT